MSSRAIKPKRDMGAERSTWHAMEERAPSVLREEGPTFARYLAVASLMCITLGGASLLFNAWGWRYLIPPGWGFLLLAIGIGGLQYHAFVEKDFQFRRLYGALGFLLLVAGAFLRFVPLTRDTGMGGSFLPYGALSMLLALGFMLSFIRNESEQTLRNYAAVILGLAAATNALAGFIGGALLPKTSAEAFLMPSGVIHLVFGLLFAVGFVGIEGISSKRGYLAGRAIGIFGLTLFVVALARSLWPWLHTQLRLGDRADAFLLPRGLIMMYLGLEYIGVYLGICSDNKLVVLIRRELAAFFYSPIAYIVMIAMAGAGWLNYIMFVLQITDDRMGRGVPEPIFYSFMASFLALIPVIFLVPIITMRMVSEEKRSGTLEVMLTSPVNEWHVVLAKFFAGLRVFTICFYLWGFFFIALRVQGGAEFDYRPIITFALALICMGAGFIAMGVFFSAVTRHQILAAVLTFVVMMAQTILFMLNQFFTEPWLNALVSKLSYIDLWISSARGVITPGLLVLNISIAIIWLFITIKVLEARKWT